MTHKPKIDHNFAPSKVTLRVFLPRP